MGIVHIASALLIALAGLLPAGCHKTSPQQKAPPVPAGVKSNAATPPAAPAEMPATLPANTLAVRNLGDVALTNHFETCFPLGGGKNCTLTPKMLDRYNVQITVAVESKTPAGKPHDLSVTQIVAKMGKPMEVAVGDFSLSLTPRVCQN